METNNKIMSVIDVLQENVKLLNSLRIPVSERELWSTIVGVTMNTLACIDAMEKAEANRKKASSDTEEPELSIVEAQDDEN